MWIFCQTGANFVATVKFAQVNCLPTDLLPKKILKGAFKNHVSF